MKMVKVFFTVTDRGNKMVGERVRVSAPPESIDAEFNGMCGVIVAIEFGAILTFVHVRLDNGVTTIFFSHDLIEE
jgi:hypothetical protein